MRLAMIIIAALSGVACDSNGARPGATPPAVVSPRANAPVQPQSQPANNAPAPDGVRCTLTYQRAVATCHATTEGTSLAYADCINAGEVELNACLDGQ